MHILRPTRGVKVPIVMTVYSHCCHVNCTVHIIRPRDRNLFIDCKRWASNSVEFSPEGSVTSTKTSCELPELLCRAWVMSKVNLSYLHCYMRTLSLQQITLMQRHVCTLHALNSNHGGIEQPSRIERPCSVSLSKAESAQ